jgi:hypothetical protein
MNVDLSPVFVQEELKQPRPAELKKNIAIGNEQADCGELVEGIAVSAETRKRSAAR